MPAPKSPQQEAEELRLAKEREQAERLKRGGHQNEDGPSESSRIGEHYIDPENKTSGEGSRTDDEARKREEEREQRERDTTKKP